jgi:hypothetical protein
MYSELRQSEDNVSQQTYGANNGRVALLPGENGAPYYMFTDAGRGTAGKDVFKDIQLNATGELFMSESNMNALQDGIRYQVYSVSGGKHTIGRQSDTELTTVMRSMLLQHGRNTTCSTGGFDLDEVRRLNKIVIDFCVNKVLSEIDIYIKYREDISQLPVPIARGQFESNKGSRSLTQNNF